MGDSWSVVIVCRDDSAVAWGWSQDHEPTERELRQEFVVKGVNPDKYDVRVGKAATCPKHGDDFLCQHDPTVDYADEWGVVSRG